MNLNASLVSLARPANRKPNQVPDYVLITVSDTGIGIAAEHLPVIFDAFVQVDASNTRAYGGSGVGLTLCKRLCELLGGDITVQSALGVGSTFTVRLPVSAPAEPPSKKVSKAQSAAPKSDKVKYPPIKG